MSRRPRRIYPNHPCLVCGEQTQAQNKLHRRCASALDDIPLPEGDWVPNGRGTVVFRVKATGLPLERKADAA